MKKRNEKLKFYASAPRAYAVLTPQYEKGNFVDYFHPKLKGNFVSLGEKSLFKKRSEAVQAARDFRDFCKSESEKIN